MENHQKETPELELMPEFVLAYMAPMACGDKYRKELLRRQQAGLATGDRLGGQLS